MRKTSVYLEGLKSERFPVRYHLAGSTPPLPPAWVPKTIRIPGAEPMPSPKVAQVTAQLAKRLKAKDGEVLLIPGSSQAMFEAIAAFTEPGDRIALEYPVYEPFVAVARFLQLKIQHFQRTGDFKADLPRIRKAARGAKVILISNPHCPTGAMYTAAEIRRLAAIGPRLIVDEVFLPLYTDGQITLTKHPNLITVSGMSKSLGLGPARIGWVCGPTKLVKQVEKISLNLNIDMPVPTAYVAEMALKHFDKIVGRYLKTSHQNRKLVHAFAKRHPGFVHGDFKTGFLVMIKIPKRYRGNDTAFAKAVLKKGVWVRPGEQFFMPGYVRLHTLLPPKDFAQAFAIFERFY